MPTEIHYSILVFYQPYNPNAALLFIIYPTLLQRLLVTFIPQIFTTTLINSITIIGFTKIYILYKDIKPVNDLGFILIN